MGRSYQVLTVRYRASGRIVAVGYRGTQPRFVNGQVEQIGYITDLVVDREFQHRWVYGRLLRQFRDAHAADPVAGYLGVIAAGHERLVRNVPTSPVRLELPGVTELATFWTLALLVRSRRFTRSEAYDVSRGSPGDLTTIIAFLRDQGRRRQFFPVYT
jgi:hypothetical protein